MEWIRASLYKTCLRVKSLPTLDLADHIMVSRQNLQIQMVPRTHAGIAMPTPTYIIHNQPAAQAAPAKKTYCYSRDRKSVVNSNM